VKVVNLTKMTRCHKAGAASHTHTHTHTMNGMYIFCLTPSVSDFQPDDLQYQLDKLDLIVSHDQKLKMGCQILMLPDFDDYMFD